MFDDGISLGVSTTVIELEFVASNWRACWMLSKSASVITIREEEEVDGNG